MSNHLQAYITNQRNSNGAWVAFPTSSEQLKTVFDRIGANIASADGWSISEYKSDITGLTANFSNHESLDELNYLGNLLFMQNDQNRIKFTAAITYTEYGGNVKKLINLAQNLDCFNLYPTIQNAEKYGYYLINQQKKMDLPENVKKYFDYQAYGRDTIISENGRFTHQGYIHANQNVYTERYDGSTIPSKYQTSSGLSSAHPTPSPALSNDQKMKAMTAYMEKGIQDVFNNGNYKEYLDVVAKFHNYSANNTLLICLQRPDASLVAGFNKWRDQFSRHVKQGEKGIQIVAPQTKKIQKEVQKIDPKTQKPIFVKEEISVPSYKVVSVFDVSQTEGKELPNMAADTLTGGVEQYKGFFAALEKTSPVPIAINNGMSEVQNIKAAIHEITYATLHNYNAGVEKGIPSETRKDHRTEEVEVASVAYIVCRHYNIDTSNYSFGYVASWSKNRELGELKNSLKVVRATAAKLINTIDKHLAEIQKEEEHHQEKQTPDDLAAVQKLLAEMNKEISPYKNQVQEEVAQEARNAGMTVDEYAANNYSPLTLDETEPPPETPSSGNRVKDFFHSLFHSETDTCASIDNICAGAKDHAKQNGGNKSKASIIDEPEL